MKEGSGDRKDKTIPYTFVYHFQKKFKADSDKKNPQERELMVQTTEMS